MKKLLLSLTMVSMVVAIGAPVTSQSASGEVTTAGKEFEFHTFDGAGHAFFAPDRPSYRPEAATEGWHRIWEFFGRHLATH